jgi:hypothetical protein
VNSSISKSLLLSFLDDRQKLELLKKGKVQTFSSGSILPISNTETNYYIIQTGSATIQKKSKKSSIVLESGNSFGHLPFVQTEDRYEVLFIKDSRIIVLTDELILSFFFTQLQYIRGYLKLIRTSGLKLISNFQNDYFQNIIKSTIITIAGSRNSGSTLYTSMLASYLSENGSVVLINMSESEKSIFESFKLNQESSVLYYEKDGKPKDLQKSLRDITESIKILNAAPLTGDSIDPDLLAPLLITLAENFTYVVIDCDLNLLSDRYMHLFDVVITVEKPGRDYQLVNSLLDASVEDGQVVYRIANRYFGSRGLSNYIYFLSEIDLQKDDDPLNNFLGVDFSYLNAHINPELKLNYLSPVYYASVGYIPEINEGEFYYAPGITAFFILVAAFFPKSQAIEIITDFFKPERQKLFYKLVFPDEKLFSHSYIVSYFKSVFKKLRIEKSPVRLIIPLKTKSGGTIHITTGLAADVTAACFLLPPFFKSYEINGLECSRDNGNNPNQLFQMIYSKISTFSVSVNEVDFPFKENSLIRNLLNGITSSVQDADFVIDLPEVKYDTIRDFLKNTVH